MAKKRRTRKQKERADLHHHDLTQSKANSPIELVEDQQETQERSSLYRFTATPTLVIKKEESHKNPLMTDYHFLKKDLIKTGILTISIILAQIALFFVLNNK